MALLYLIGILEHRLCALQRLIDLECAVVNAQVLGGNLLEQDNVGLRVLGVILKGGDTVKQRYGTQDIGLREADLITEVQQPCACMTHYFTVTRSAMKGTGTCSMPH